jgi:hypothetical protein
MLGLEETELVGTVAHQHVLGLLVVVQHLRMVQDNYTQYYTEYGEASVM